MSALPWRKGPCYPLKEDLGGKQSQCGQFGEKSNFLSLLEIEPFFFGRPYLSVVTVPTSNNSAYSVKAFWKARWHMTTYLGSGVDPVVDYGSQIT